MRVTGRAAVVTGGAVGIGLAVAERIGAVFVLADLADRVRVAPAVGTSAERLGRLDILINNAGGAGHGSHYPSASPRAWQEVVDLNLHAVMAASQLAIDLMAGVTAGRS